MSLNANTLAIVGVALGIFSIVIALPAALIANILTPRVQNWWASRSSSRTAAYTKKLEDELDYITELSSDTHALQVYFYIALVIFIIRCTLTLMAEIVIAVILISGTIYSLISPHHTDFGIRTDTIVTVLLVVGQLMYMFVTFSTFYTMFHMLRTLRRLRDFPSFKAKAEERIAKRKAPVP